MRDGRGIGEDLSDVDKLSSVVDRAHLEVEGMRLDERERHFDLL
jgi:hypothetical protein